MIDYGEVSINLARAIESAAQWLGDRQLPKRDLVVRELVHDYMLLSRQLKQLGIDPIAYGITIKTIGQIITQYRDGLTSLVYETFNHRMDATDMRRDMKALIRELAPQALQEGWREGGLTENAVEDEDQQWADEGVADWIAEQVQYVNDFAKATYDAGVDRAARSDILDRVEMWVDAMRRLGELGTAYAVKAEKAYWALGERETHTPDCVRLSQGAPHRVQWFIDRGYAPPLHFDCGCAIKRVSDDSVIMGEG